MFNPMQSQAAIQNPARFPDQKLQQYAAGKPPQPTGQVTPPMAGQELAQRGADRQAFQNQAAMQNNPKNSPTIYQELMMKEQMVNQQAQALGQKEQQLGMAGAMLAKKARDIAERERGIAALPVRPDMFTAMDGGIVFRQGGGVKGYSGVDGLSLVGGNVSDEARALDQLRVERILEERKRKEDLLRLELLEKVAPEAAAKLLRENPDLRPPEKQKPPSTIDSNAPSTTRDTPANVAATTTPAPPSMRGITSGMFDKYMGRMSKYMTTPKDVAESRAGIRGQLAGISSAAEQARPLEGQAREDFEKKERDRLAQEYAEYTAGRGGRREKAAEAIRGQKPDLGDYLGAMAAGGPGKTLAETLSRMVPGAAKLRVDQQAREMAAAKFLAEAEELDAKADLAERRGQTTAARALSDQADQRRLRAFEVQRGATSTIVQGLGALATSGMEESSRNANIAATGAGAELKAELEARIQSARMAYEAGKPTEMMRNAQWISQTTGQPIGSVVTSLITKGRDTDAYPSAVQAKIYENIATKYSDPHNPAVIAEVQKIDPAAARILSLGKKEAERQRDYGAALAVVEQAMDAELRSRLNKPLNYSALPAPPSK